MAPATKIDPYATLHLEKGCSEKDIKKAYLKQCLKWHPDKNPDNLEQAKKMFELVHAAYKLMTNKEARKEYDTKKESDRMRDEKQRERMEKADVDRKRHIETLERKEKEAAQGFQGEEGQRPKTAAEKKREENNIKASYAESTLKYQRMKNEELRKKEELERTARAASAAQAAERIRPTLQVKWKKGDYDRERLTKIFEKYGKISAVSGVLVRKTGGKMSVVEFEPGENAWGAELVRDEGDQLKASWMNGKEPEKIMKKEEQRPNSDSNGQRDEMEEDLSSLSFEELQERMFGGPPTQKRQREDGGSWKDEL